MACGRFVGGILVVDSVISVVATGVAASLVTVGDNHSRRNRFDKHEPLTAMKQKEDGVVVRLGRRRDGRGESQPSHKDISKQAEKINNGVSRSIVVKCDCLLDMRKGRTAYFVQCRSRFALALPASGRAAEGAWVACLPAQVVRHVAYEIHCNRRGRGSVCIESCGSLLLMVQYMF